MKKHLQLVLSLLMLVALLVLPYFVFATNSTSSTLGTLSAVAKGGGYQSSGTAENLLPTILGTVINVALGLLGTIFIILIIIGGYIWMTASGNEESIKKAHNYISRAIIGLIITLSAWGIWFLIFQKFILKG